MATARVCSVWFRPTLMKLCLRDHHLCCADLRQVFKLRHYQIVHVRTLVNTFASFKSTALESTGNTSSLKRSDSLVDAGDAPRPESSTNINSSDKEQKKSRWSKWTGKNAWKASLLFLGLLSSGSACFIVAEWGAPQRDQDGELIMDEYSKLPAWQAYPLRAFNAAKNFFQMVLDPTSEKLLPDPLPPPYIQPPYTLVLELTDLLLSPQWDVKMGWRFKKRPGLDYFLQQMAQNGYEIVIFTKEAASTAFPIINTMDQHGTVWYRLYREDTRYKKGVHIKDLNCLNRNLAKVILIDIQKEVFELNPRNGIALPKWDGQDDDRVLYDLAAFLHTISANKVEDVRGVIDYYNQFDDPLAKFRENQAAVQKTQEEIQKMQDSEKKKRFQSPFLASDLRRR